MRKCKTTTKKDKNSQVSFIHILKYCGIFSLTPLRVTKTLLDPSSNQTPLSCFLHLAVVVQLLSRVCLFVAPWTTAHRAFLCFTISWSFLKLMSVQSVMPSNHLFLCRPLLPSIFPSIRVFSNESVLQIRWPKYSSFSVSHSNKYSGLISFRMDWLDLFAVQGTLESSPAQQFKSINSLILSFLYGPTLTSIHDYWKNHSFD